MNWVGGARNRVKGTHKNDMRLQKEFFERKRLQQLNQPTQTRNVDNNRDKPKKSKVSQDIISFQRQCRLNNRPDVGLNTTLNFRRVDLKSRSFSKGVNKFGVKAVELPMSPINKPSMLHLSSPPRNSGPPRFRHGPIPHCNTTAAATSSINQSASFDLFGEPTLRPHAPIGGNQPKQANLGTFENMFRNYTTATSGPYDMLVPYRPRENSRDFPSPPSSENEYGRENHTVPNSFYPPMLNNELSSLYECPNTCHQCDNHQETDFRQSSSFHIGPHFKHTTTTTCSDGNKTQLLFEDKKKKSKFSVRIVRSPESQVSLSSEASTLNNWSQTNDVRSFDQTFNQFKFYSELEVPVCIELPCEREYPLCNSSQRNCSGFYESNALAQWQQQDQASRCPPNTNEHYFCSEQTHMTNIKETHRDNSLCHRPQIWTNYARHATITFPTPPSNYREQAPSTCFVVSTGLDSTPNTSYHRHVPKASPLNFGQGKIFQSAALDTNRDVHSTALIKLESGQNTIQSEDPIESINSGKQIIKSTLNSIRSPVEMASGCKQSNTSSIHSSGSKSLKADEKIVRDTTHSQASVAAPPSCKSTNSNETPLIQEVSYHELIAEKNTNVNSRNTPQFVDALGADFDTCKGMIVSPRSTRGPGHVTSSAGVAYSTQPKEFTDITNAKGLSICTQTTPKVYRDTACSPIKEVVGKQTVHLPSYVIGDSLISSSVHNMEQYQAVHS